MYHFWHAALALVRVAHLLFAEGEGGSCSCGEEEANASALFVGVGM